MRKVSVLCLLSVCFLGGSHKVYTHTAKREGKIIFLDGIPAVGKSSVAKALKRKLKESHFSVEIVESDVIAERMKEQNIFCQSVHKAVERAVEFSQKPGTIAIVDAFLWPRAQRKFDKIASDVYYVLLYAPLDMCEKRMARRQKRPLSEARKKSLRDDFEEHFSPRYGASHSERPGKRRKDLNRKKHIIDNYQTNFEYHLILNSEEESVESLADKIIQAL